MSSAIVVVANPTGLTLLELRFSYERTKTRPVDCEIKYNELRID